MCFVWRRCVLVGGCVLVGEVCFGWGRGIEREEKREFLFGVVCLVKIRIFF